MKKVLGILLSLMLLLTLFAGCGSETADNDTTVAVSAADVTSAETDETEAESTEPETAEETTTEETSTEEPEKEAEDEEEDAAVAQDEADEAVEAAADEETSEPDSGETESGFTKLLSFVKEHTIGALAAGCGLILLVGIIGAVVSARKAGSENNPSKPDKAAEPTGKTTTLRYEPDLPVPIKVVCVQNIGKRKKQEDSFGVSDLENEALCSSKGVLVAVADGMGGLQDGEDVSSVAVKSMLDGFADMQNTVSDTEELERLLKSTVRAANAHLKRGVGLRKGGSTLMAAIIHDWNVSWVSVGDSRMALFRRGKLTDLNERHNFGTELDALVRQNKLSAEKAKSHPDREKLTSYIGMGELEYVDRSVRPLPTTPADKIILMTDGIFNTLTDPEIEQILNLPMEWIAERLEQSILQKNNPYQDNYTAIIIEFQVG